MKEIYGELFHQVDADAICITTNGAVRRDGRAVMGRGCALLAKYHFYDVDKMLGTLIRDRGNRVFVVSRHAILKYDVLSFPVKHHWKDKADLDLIMRSAEQLVEMADANNYKKIVIPRPGCGNGKLEWSQVKPILSNILDDRFSIITWAEETRDAI